MLALMEGVRQAKSSLQNAVDFIFQSHKYYIETSYDVIRELLGMTDLKSSKYFILGFVLTVGFSSGAFGQTQDNKFSKKLVGLF